MNDKIIICDLDHKDIEPEKAVFDNGGYGYSWLHCATQDEVIEKCGEATVLLNQYVRMDEKIFKALPNVKCIVRYGVGYDNVNLDDATKYGVQICNVPDYGTREVASHALAHMMTLTRKINISNKIIREGIWDYQKNIPIYRFSECTVGICGIGRIGSEFAKYVQALGCRIIAYDIDCENKLRHFPDFVEFVSFEQMLEESDIISIHCPRDERTYHMFSENEFKKMKNSAFIINVSRGGIIDEDALCRALENKWIAGAGIDVVEEEQLKKDNPLLKFDNFTISPHSAWYSEQSAIELKRKVAEEAVRFLSGEGVHYPVNKLK